MLYFLRDDSNNLLGFTYQGDTYYYKKNAFDDIIGIYDSNYKEVCTYNYDSYGNILSIKDSTGKDITDTSNVAIINPFRYRSYYYDTETNLYYLNSRYYSPKMGRFINCDGLINSSETTQEYNLYAYCNNNFTGYRDEFGGKGLLESIHGFASSAVSNVISTASKVIGCVWKKPVSGGMFSASLEKKNLEDSRYKKTKQQLTEKLASSSEIKEIVKNSVSTASGNKFSKSGSTEFIKDRDLYLSVQHANYIVSGTKQNNYWTIQVKVIDTYDFDKYRDGYSFGVLANNFGYALQNNNLLQPYAWDVDFMIFYSESVDN